MSGFKKICQLAGKAIFDFSMIEEGDKILICFSGGKDSFALIHVLKELKKKYLTNFELGVLCVDPGFDSSFLTKINNILENENLKFEIYNSEISEILNSELEKKKFRPCFLCSRMRRGIIYNYAIENRFNKIALGHNLNDAIETQLMNMFFSSKTSFLKPMYLAENGKIEVIRPLVYVDEEKIVDYINFMEYIPVENNCILRKNDSKRDFFRQMVLSLKKENPQIMENCLNSFSNISELNCWNLKK